MPLTEAARWVLAGLLTATLVWASVSDVRARRIPNWSVLATIGLFLPWAALGPLGAVPGALAACAIALAGTFVLYLFGIVGAGDSKLFAAVALFAGLGHLGLLAVLTALSGGLVAVVSLAARPYRAMTMMTLRGKGDFGRGVPYGVAIGMAALVVVWAPLLHMPLPTVL